MPRFQSQTLAQYSKLLHQASESLAARDGRAPKKWIGGLPIREPGLLNLLNSFTSMSARTYDPNIEEWNPFSQRPIFETLPDSGDTFNLDFQKINEAAYRFIIFAHESMHVLLWEPFFTGRLSPNRKQFKEYSLAFEGLCFWFGDIIVNRKMRLLAPDGELVFSRNAASQPHFHPYRVFDQMKIKKEDKILDVYLAAFCGQNSGLKGASGILPRNLNARFEKFYKGTHKPTNRMFDTLKRIGIFEEYFERFCRQPGIPTLLPEPVLNLASAGDLLKYCHSVYQKGMPHIEGLSRVDIEAVRVRRSIQTRAYFAYCLRHLVGSRYITKAPAFEVEPCLREIEIYLEGLDSALAALCEQKTALSRKLLDRADRHYGRAIHSEFSKSKLATTRREHIIPELPGHTVLHLFEDRSNLSDRDMTKFCQAILDQYAIPSLDLKSQPELSRDLLVEIEKTVSILVECKKRKSAIQKLRAQVDQLLLSELVFRRWSVPLASISPQHNRFRELLFLYA